MEHQHILRLVELAQSTGIERERACNELYGKYFPQTRAYCASLLRKNWNDSEVQDFTAEVMARVFTKLHTFSGKWYLTIWIKAVCLNHFRDKLRHLETQKHTLVDLSKARSIESGATADSRMICNDHLRILNGYIGENQPLHAQVMHLFFNEQKTYKEISSLTNGTPVSSISSILSRSRKKLFGKLER